MEAIYITMSVTVLLAGLFLYLFFRNVKTGQYDDTYTPSVRMLFDDELVPESKENNKKKSYETPVSKKITKSNIN